MADPIPGQVRPGQGEDHHRPSDDNGGPDQSKKKARKEPGSFSGIESRKSREEEWMEGNQGEKDGAGSKKSYRDAVRNPNRSLNFDEEEKNDNHEATQEDEAEDEKQEDSDASSEESIDPVDPTGNNNITIDRDVFNRLNFTLSDKEWKRLCKPFKKLLIIKLLGKTIGFKFLLRKYCVHGRARKIEYEGLHLIYFECGIYGHDLEHCPIHKARQEREKREKEMNSEKGLNFEERTDKPMSEVIDRYGAWMSAQKPIRARRPRFTILEESDHEKQDNGNTNPINKENSESESKVWTKPRKNPIFQDQENMEKSPPINLDMMVLVSPIKSDNKEAELTEMQPDDGGGSVAMVISPIKNKEQNSKGTKDDRVESNQNQNRKDKPPDMGKKKPVYSKGQNAGKMQSKGSRRESPSSTTPTGRKFALSFKELKRIYKPDMVFLFETRYSGKKAENSIKNCGFTHNDISDARGFSG
ncbi:uncharacterized protein G2W53_018013 [Senna tora]|uniref:Zinc knuckle CX2CX4HX4C domain-containing protein n=1 Tax=Senna tora TaxID=362788 RepID=A0A834WRD3_9FABA|nr:uncharacterized protein G2W53_018013 [Senna tora]